VTDSDKIYYTTLALYTYYSIYVSFNLIYFKGPFTEELNESLRASFYRPYRSYKILYSPWHLYYTLIVYVLLSLNLCTLRASLLTGLNDSLLFSY
jgi:hypothetical protein